MFAMYGLDATGIEDFFNQSSAIMRAIAYPVFDPVKILLAFNTLSERNKAALTDVPITVKSFGDFKLKIYEKPHATLDLIFFLTIYLERGNNVSKMLLKSDKYLAAIIRRKCATYCIPIESATMGSMPVSQITLSRLSLAYANVTAEIIINRKIPGKLSSRLFQKVTVPLLMQHTVFPCLISTTVYTAELRYIAVILNVEMSYLFASTREKMAMCCQPLSDLMEKSAKFVDAALSNNHITDTCKIQILQKAEVIANNNLSVAVSAMAEQAEIIKQYKYMTLNQSIQAMSYKFKDSNPMTSVELAGPQIPSSKEDQVTSTPPPLSTP